MIHNSNREQNGRMDDKVAITVVCNYEVTKTGMVGVMCLLAGHHLDKLCKEMVLIASLIYL